MMADLVALLGFVVVLAALADSALNQQAKDKIAGALLNSSGQPSFNLPLNRAADGWLGARLISIKSLRRSAYFSIFSILLSLFAAGFPNVSVIFDVFGQILLNSNTGMIVLLVSLIGCIFADYVSIIQTRIFARAIEKFKSGPISVILCVADLAMSLTFFVFVFSVFRVICYTIIIKFMIAGSYDYKVKLYPSIAYRTINAFPEARKPLLSFIPTTETRGQGSLLQAMYAAGELGDNANAAQIANRMRDVELAGFDIRKVGSKYLATAECFDGPAAERNVAPKAYEAYASTYNLMYNGLREVNDRLPLNDILKRFDQEFQNELKSNHICKSKGFSITKMYDAEALLRDLSFGEAYLGAFTLTLRDTFSSISTKLAAYYTADLSNEVPEFLRNGWMAKSQTFLGAGGENPKARYIGSYISNSDLRPSEYAVIPTTTYIVSSMSVSLVLIFSVAVKYLLAATIIARHFAQTVINRAYVEKSVMTSLALVASLIVITIAVVQWLVSQIWQLII